MLIILHHWNKQMSVSQTVTKMKHVYILFFTSNPMYSIYIVMNLSNIQINVQRKIQSLTNNQNNNQYLQEFYLY